MKMNKIKANLPGMTLVEILVAMTLFTIMFMMIFGIMTASIKLNADTRVYDQEVDWQVEDAERYNPLGAVVDGVTSSSNHVYGYDDVTGVNKFPLSFMFSSAARTIEIDAYAYRVRSRNEYNGYSLKFFSSTRPDTVNNKYWIRVINVSSTDNEKIYLYLPKENHGSFYLKNESEPYTTVLSKVVPLQTALGVGYDMTDSGNKYFWVSTLQDLNHEQLETTAIDKNFILIDTSTLLLYDKEGDGYIDIYYTDDGFKNYDDYETYLNSNP